MAWHDLLFAHWPVPASQLEPLLPAGLELDRFDGEAWLGIVPFRMSGVRLRRTPALPGPGGFPELNVRTYVRAGDKPGVWFFSLDARSRIAVFVARSWFRLPYFAARMRTSRQAEAVDYRSERRRGSAAFVARYRPTGPVFRARPGSLEHWLTERYCLYAPGGRGLLRGEIHHPPWPLQPATAEIAANTMTQQLGFELPDVPPLLHFARSLGVVAWSPRALSSVSSRS